MPQTLTTPTIVAPTPSGLLDTNRPVLSATLFGTEYSYAEWQFASDISFTTNLRTITEPVNIWRPGGTASFTLDKTNALFPAVWYYRVRAWTTDGLQWSAWSTTYSFSIAHPPVPGDLEPNAYETRKYGGGGAVDLSWSFTDTSPDDYQTAYQIVVAVAGGAQILDTGKVVSSAKSASVSIGAGYKDTVLTWKICLWDSSNTVGSYSALQNFRVSDPPSVSITSPTPGGTVAASNPLVTWTSSKQSSYRVVLTASGVTIHDSGWLSGSVRSYRLPAVIATGVSYTVRVDVRDSTKLENSASAAFTASWAAPTQPIFAVDTSSYSTAGYVRLTWSNGQQDANFVRYEVWRRKVGAATWDVLGTVTAIQGSYSFDDYTAPANTSLQYAVVQFKNNSGNIVPSANASTNVLPVDTFYWLIFPDNPSFNLLLRNITADSFTNEQERQTHNVINRGRKVSIGTRYGYNGTLSAQIRDDNGRTAREIRQDLLALQESSEQCYLRNPFGDIFPVSLGDISLTRVAGVGANEYVDIQIPYSEVAA